jgi:TolB-like protein/Tfp pilus assembly protein PilF
MIWARRLVLPIGRPVPPGVLSMDSPTVARFGEFEAHISSRELYRNGERLRLHDQPFQILAILLERHGELVLREEIQRRLWPDHTVVDFNHSINSAIKKLRRSLGDRPRQPQYIETLPKRGYRFVGQVSWASPAPEVSTVFASQVGQQHLTRAPVPAGDRPSIAVLPFLNLSGNKDNDYLAELFSEEITNALSRIPQLKVIARTSTSIFRERSEDVRRIAHMLNVRSILEGSLQKAGMRIRVAARLIDGETGSHLWSEQYEREFGNLFATEDDIVTALISTIKLRLSLDKDVKRHRPPPLAAARAFLKGRYYLQKVTPDDFRAARELFEQAIELDPSYAEPQFELGTFYLFQCLAGAEPSGELIPLVRVQAEKTLAADPSFLAAHALLGCAAAVLEYDWKEAERQFAKAFASDFIPGFVRFWYMLLFLNPLGRFEEGIAQMQAAVEEDPLNAYLRINLSAIHYWAGQYEESLRYIIEAMELNENLWICHFGMGCVDFKMGRVSQAVSSFERARELAPWSAQILGHLAGLYRLLGSVESSNEIVLELRRLPTHAVPLGMTIFHSISSEADSAAEWLMRAIDLRDPLTLIFIFNPATEVMRRSSLWPSLLQRMNLAGTRGCE